MLYSPQKASGGDITLLANKRFEAKGAVGVPVADDPGVDAGVAEVEAVTLSAAVRLALWAAGFALALWLAFLYSAGGGVHNDFTQNVWLPARLVLDGADPYYPTQAEVNTALGSYSAQFDIFNSGSEFHFIYPMWVALAFVPFGAMPLVIATAIWRALNLLLLVWSVGSVLRASNPAFRVTTPVALGALLLTVVLSIFYRESLLTLIIGQFAIIELGLLAGVWGWLIRSRRMSSAQRKWGDALTGIALAVLATKPQSVGLVVLLLVAWAFARRRFAIPFTAALSLTALMLLPLIFYPASLGNWLKVVFGGQAASQTEVSASVWGVSYYLLGDGSPWKLVALLLSLIGLATLAPLWWRDLRDKASPLPFTVLVTLCINSVVSPYMLGYEHVLLLLPALVLIAAAGLPEGNTAPKGDKKVLRVGMYIWMAVLPLLVVSIQGGLEKEWPAIAQSLPMLAILWTTRVNWSEDVQRDKDHRN